VIAQLADTAKGNQVAVVAAAVEEIQAHALASVNALEAEYRQLEEAHKRTLRGLLFRHGDPG
jgi:hypothetical protein